MILILLVHVYFYVAYFWRVCDTNVTRFSYISHMFINEATPEIMKYSFYGSAMSNTTVKIIYIVVKHRYRVYWR